MSRHPTPQAARRTAPPRLALRTTAVAVHLLLAGVAVGGWVGAAQAQTPAAASARSYNIPAGPLNAVLTRFLDESGVLLSGSAELAQGKQSPGVQGNRTPDTALAALLAGTGLQAVADEQGRYVLRTVPVVSRSGGDIPGEAELATVTVTAGADLPGSLPEPFAGGQVARGGRVGLLGNRDIFDIPFSQNNYTEQLIRDQQARSVADVLANDSSVRPYVTPTGEDLFVVRGFSVDPDAMTFDGLYGMVDGRRPILENVERIEIRRGPTAALGGLPVYGAVGGTINFVPKRATDEPLTRVTGRYLSDSNFGGLIDLGRRFGTDNEFGVRLNVAHDDGETPIDNQKLDRSTAALGLDFLGDRLRLSADLSYSDQSIAGPQRLLTVAPGFDIPNAPRADRLIQQPWETIDTDFRAVVGRIEYDLTQNLTAFAAYGHSDYGEKFFQGNPRLLNAQGDIRQQIVYYNFEIENKTAEIGLRASFLTGPVSHQAALVATDLSWTASQGPPNVNIVGAPILNNIYAPVVFPELSRAGFSLRPLSRVSTQDLTGVAIADTLSILDERAQLTTALRWQNVKSADFDVVTGARSTSYDESKVTPVVALLVKALPWLSVYGSYTEGLSQGPTAPTTGVSNPGEVFPPFVSKQYEVGAKADFGALGLTAAVFQITQPSAFTDPTTNRFGVDGEQRNRGMELSAFGEVARGVRLLGGVSILDGTLTNTQGGAFNGNDAVGVPEIQLNFGGEYDLGLLPGLTVSGLVLYTGKQFQDQANTRSIPSWTRLDLGARYLFKLQGRQMAARFNIENVSGEDYWQGTGFGLLSIGGPRTYLLSLSVDL